MSQHASVQQLKAIKELSMPARATQRTLTDKNPVSNLFLPVPDTDFREFLDEIDELALFAPEIIDFIEKDLDAYAREKKRLRLEDRKFFDDRTEDLPELNIEEKELVSEELELAIGRPRMSAHTVYVFLMIRGFLGSLTSKPAHRFLYESMNLYGYLQSRNLKMPGMTTILENVNLVSHATRELIFDKHIKFVLKEELDDFKELTIDSTSVKANSMWPTDGKVLTGLLMRANRLGQKLHIFGFDNFCQGWVTFWLKKMDALEFSICLVAGKANSKGKVKTRYRSLFKHGRKVVKSLTTELNHFKEGLSMDTLAPSRRELLNRILKQISNDITDANRVIKYAEDRVFRNMNYPSTEKILSLSDGSAAYIIKGNRNPVIGYKPQLVRSKNGFVTSLIVPEGNAADSVKLVPAIKDSIKRAGVITELVSTDDGYASKTGRKEVLGLGVKVVSISGAKGKKLTNPDDWDAKVYRDARRNRSAVESLMFTIKDGFAFGEPGRRGIDAVRDELLEKVLAYNCCRAILIRKRKKDELKQAA